jgi:hypothetical protein
VPADEAPDEQPEAPAASAGSPGSAVGNGSKLPKRQVADRSQPRGSGMPGPAGTTDMFAAARSSFGGGPAAGGQPPEPAEPGPAQTPEQPSAPELAGAGFAPQPSFQASDPDPRSGGASATGGGSHGSTNGFNGTSNGSNGTAHGSSGGYSWDAASPADEVVVPPAEHTTEYRLPIFEAVESDWFRRGRSSVGWAPQEQDAEPEKANWSSPADEGWQAAAAVAAPSSSGVTSAGLPKRVPKANLVPGTAGSETSSAPAPAPARSASVTRDRFASFQRGSREGRAAATSDSSSAGEDDGSR